METNRTKKVTLGPKALCVLLLASEGKSNKEIAAEMSISLNTVDSHWRAIFKKLGAAGRTQAVCLGLGHAYREQFARAEREYARVVEELVRAKRLEDLLREAHEELRASSVAKTEGMATHLIGLQKRAAQTRRDAEAAGLFEAASRCAHAVAYDIESINPVVHRRFSASADLFGIDVARTLSGEATFYHLVHPEDLSRILELSLGAQFLPNERYVYLYRLLTPEPRWILDSHQAVYTAGGVFDGVVGMAMDVHELVVSGSIEPKVARVVVPSVPVAPYA